MSKRQGYKPNDTYIDEEPFIGKYQESRKSKITRVNRLYNLFSELSPVEKENFINLIKNYLVHGR